VVLSNNDGCVISRSNEAKKLKIPMGALLLNIKMNLKTIILRFFHQIMHFMVT